MTERPPRYEHDPLIADFTIEERLDLHNGTPMGISEAIDPKSGWVHPDLLRKLATGLVTEVRLSIDSVRVSRHMTRGELELLLKEVGR